MASEVVARETEHKLHSLAAWFDTESAGVVTILLGIFQMVLSVSFAYSSQSPHKLFILTLVIGILIVTGGSFTMANERNPSRLLLQVCVCTNLAGLMVALLAFCLYCYSLSSLQGDVVCSPVTDEMYDYELSYYQCPPEQLKAYSWSVTLLLMLYDTGAAVMLGLLSVSGLRTLKTK